MFVKYQINLSTVPSGTTATTINVPINMDFHFVGQSEEIEEKFVAVETEKAINPIIDYEKVRVTPTDLNGIITSKIRYNVNLNGNTSYGSIGFSDEDIRYEKNNFKQTFLNLNFYDTDNPMSQILVSYITLFSYLKPTDLHQKGSTSRNYGTTKPANEISLNFDVENPVLNFNSLSEGYHLYDYKDELNIGETKYLYMRASFKNAKSGKSDNLMIQSEPDTIDKIIHKLYTRYKLTRTTTGYYYSIDDSYSSNVTYTTNNNGNDITVNLYQLKVL